MAGKGAWLQFGVPFLLLLVGAWIAYRAVNLPAFADFLIAVEAEMNKVSWPTWSELFRASLVVIIVIFALAAILFGFDIFWKFVFVKMGIA
jgi:preprotein translocase subunit SecE